MVTTVSQWVASRTTAVEMRPPQGPVGFGAGGENALGDERPYLLDDGYLPGAFALGAFVG
ncbi:hypothetical protein BBN63_03985 [Streptomyces niveus]|uniref:Uncharacterized protein n=1 Tax=Streptomyces niveus TaxID=193462 RepID=A0A1U9QN75_STRNV|nr:hypothetical protein BBN63_03985 [Streptomyces niveus]